MKRVFQILSVALYSLYFLASPTTAFPSPKPIVEDEQLVLQNRVKPEPGHLITYFSIKSLNNIYETLGPVLAYYYLSEQRYEIGIDVWEWLYSVAFDYIYFAVVEDWSHLSIQLVEDTESHHDSNTKKVALSFWLGELQIDTRTEVYLFHLIPIVFNSLRVDSIRFQIELSIETYDKVNWLCHQETTASFKQIEIATDSIVLNFLLYRLHFWVQNEILKRVHYIDEYIQYYLNIYNSKMQNEVANAFMVPVFPNAALFPFSQFHPFNYQMMSAPVIDSWDEMIELYMDGLFYDLARSSFHVNEGDRNKVYPPYYENSHKEQFWIHQGLLNSYLYSFGRALMPVLEGSPELVDSLLSLLQLDSSFVSDTQSIQYKLILDGLDDTQLIQLNRERGMVVGSLARAQSFLQVDVVRMKETDYEEPFEEEKQEVEVFQSYLMNFEAQLNVTLKDFVLYTTIESLEIKNSSQTFPKEAGDLPTNLDQQFQQFFQLKKEYFNKDFGTNSEGHDFRHQHKVLSLLQPLLKNLTMSVYQEDHFIYGGFDYFSDF